MPVRSVTKDLNALTLTVAADYAVPLDRVWDAWANPRLLEQFWGPPTWPATFTIHEFRVGGRAAYHMTGPDGARSSGWWRFLRIDPPRSFDIEDGFADDENQPNAGLPTTRMQVSLEIGEGVTRMTMVSTFASREALEQLLAMGMEEGLAAALGQLDGILETPLQSS